MMLSMCGTGLGVTGVDGFELTEFGAKELGSIEMNLCVLVVFGAGSNSYTFPSLSLWKR